MPETAPQRARTVLFLCTGNSARSILAEALLNHLGTGAFRAFSAGSRPTGRVHPLALELLARHGIPARGARSKSWEEFAAPAGNPIDVVITVCASAAADACPVWPGAPVALHWDIADPAAATGGDAERRAAFERAFRALDGHIRNFIARQLVES